MVKERIALIVAEFFYCGRAPIGPGTAGSMGSLLIWIPSVYFSWPLWLHLVLLVGIFIIGVWASRYAIAHYQQSDPKQVVIDEVVGQGIPFLIAANSPLQWLSAFLLFRLFDIWKPWPIKNIERRFPDCYGIMLDDVVAGIMALVVLYLGQIL